MSKAADLANLIGNINAGGGGVNRNVIINGAMNVAQRGTSAVAAASGNYTTVDRYASYESTDGAYTVEQSTDAPTGFSKSLKAQVTTADTSIASGQYAQLVQRIEAQNLQHLDYGLSTAKTLALSFFVKSSKTGTYCITAYKDDATGSASTMLFPKEFSISSANTWEKKTITIEPDSQIKSATGVIDDDNGSGMQIFWNLAQGSTYTGGTDGTWSTNTAHYATTNQVNWMDSTSNNFYLTGVQLEVGQNPTSFEHEPIDVTLAKCQRYFQAYDGGGAGAKFATGFATSTTVAQYSIGQQVGMRANATVDASNVKIWDVANEYTISSVTGATSYDGEVTFQATGSGLTQYRSCSFRQQASGNAITIDAEL